ALRQAARLLFLRSPKLRSAPTGADPPRRIPARSGAGASGSLSAPGAPPPSPLPASRPPPSCGAAGPFRAAGPSRRAPAVRVLAPTLAVARPPMAYERSQVLPSAASGSAARGRRGPADQPPASRAVAGVAIAFGLLGLLGLAGCSGGGGAGGGGGSVNTGNAVLEKVRFGRLADVYGLRTSSQGTTVDLVQVDVMIGADIQDERPPNSDKRAGDALYGLR